MADACSLLSRPRKPLLEFDDLNYFNADYIRREVKERFRVGTSGRDRAKARRIGSIKDRLTTDFSSELILPLI